MKKMGNLQPVINIKALKTLGTYLHGVRWGDRPVTPTLNDFLSEIAYNNATINENRSGK
ncbi:MAG: hypothetical protein AB1546_00470 [bacterium]